MKDHRLGMARLDRRETRQRVVSRARHALACVLVGLADIDQDRAFVQEALGARDIDDGQ
jgi:hypothetical protein